ncbi:MAG: hypothetical protein BHV81_13535 [Butyricimonas synergistica]|nr:MAG: hypothetical protein BHV81_13535 [Butyricimonas synergistica]
MAISDYMEDLIYRILAGEANVEEQEEFEIWLREDDEHRVFFEKIERAWYTGKYAARWKNVEMSAAWKAVEHKRELGQRRYFRRIGWSVAAAVAVLVVFTWVMFLGGEKSPETVIAQSVIGRPGESKALLVLSSGTKVELNSQIGDTIREEGRSILNERDYIDYSRQDNDSQVKEVVYNELIVPAGGEYRLVLSDGSVVYMNSESRLKYPVKFIEDKRVVKLEGEAYFDVTHDEQHPFIVHTEQLNVKVLGTGFNVMAYKGDARTEVTLVHGKVDVKSKNISEILTPSRQFVMNNDTREYEVRSVNVNTYVDWKNGILNFDAMPLEELGEKVSRWYGVKFFFSKESLKYLKFSGAFKKYNNIDYILDLIEATTDVSFELKGDVVIVNEK